MKIINLIRFKPFLLIFLLIFNGAAIAEVEDKSSDAEKAADAQKQYQTINLQSFIANNQISQKLADEKKRVMLPPSAIQFSARLMAPAKPGKFTLAYDALQLWGGGEMPRITHSSYLAADNGKVIGVYVSQAAARQLQHIATEQLAQFYAIHIYNYSGGPRLVVVAVNSEINPD